MSTHQPVASRGERRLPAPSRRAPKRRRHVLSLAGTAAWLALAAWLAPVTASAQSPYPARALRLIVPFPPGGAADAIGRVLAVPLGERLQQAVTVDNRPGAGTIVAATAVAAAEPDGYTLSLATTGQLTINPALHAKLPYDPVKSFQPVVLVADVPFVIAVPAASALRTAQDLAAEARRQPQAFAYSSCGNGTVCHLTGELFKSQTGASLNHIPFSGSAPAITALLGGHVQVAADTVTVLAPHLKSGALRGLVVSARQRSPVAPDVPSAPEAGLPDFIASSWFGVVVPAGTPAPIVERLQREIDAILHLPAVREQFAKLGVTPLGGRSEDFAAQIRADTLKWGQVVRTANVRVD